MSPVYHLLLIPLLCLVCYQDWKYRAVHWILFPCIGIDTFLIFFTQQGDMLTAGLNLAFVALLTCFLFFYVSLKEQKWTNIFRSHFGLGDVLFFVAISPLFSEVNFVLFFCTGTFLTLLIHGLIQVFSAQKNIPLAGDLAIYVVFIQLGSYLCDINLFHHPFIP